LPVEDGLGLRDWSRLRLEVLGRVDATVGYGCGELLMVNAGGELAGPAEAGHDA
jgi:hypothetical protein